MADVKNNKSVSSEDSNQGSSTDFSKIVYPSQLLEYLTSVERIKTRKLVYHYTRLSSIISIVKSGYWIIKSPKGMNDNLEYQNWDEKYWHNVFFASFMLEQKESIGMWSMYSQPWNKGVKVAIDGVAFKKWIREVKEVYLANPDTNEIYDISIPISKLTTINHAAVAYVDFDKEDQSETLHYSNISNQNIKNVFNMPQLCGYIKNDAWSYEKELRLRVDVDKSISCSAVAIKVTKDLLKAITIVKGPRFEGNLEQEILKEIEKEKSSILTYESSLFFGKLQSIPCDYCKIMKIFETARLIIKTKIELKERFPCLSDDEQTGEIDLMGIQENDFLKNGFRCFLRETNQEVCHIGLSKYEDKFEINYGVETRFRKKGYISEALPVVISWIFTNTDISELYARICNNSASEHILIKNGFILTDEPYHKCGKIYKLNKEKKTK